MKTPGIEWLNPKTSKCFIVALVIALSVVFCLGVASASSEGEGKAKGWVSTDTYRVMNFAVLAIGLFLLIRKPASNALDARIKGIKEQLSELEAKKKDAEKNLEEYKKKFSLLEQEAEKLVEDYIRQGNEAKVRILAEAKLAAEKLEEQARRNIEHEFKEAKLKLQEDILEKALIKAEALITDKITAEDQDKLVDEYLNKVVA
ncbi:MAG: ATP synthase F0 subunit B [Desulfobacterales bacterium]|nr:MAG: ATP synthase F0 subunit B [Desulfobacterales bacterium]